MEFQAMVTIFVLILINFDVKLVSAVDLPGHLQPLGSHMPPLQVEIRDDMPSPAEFLNSYVMLSKPVLFRGAAKLFPSFDKWKNDSHLRTEYSDWEIEAEHGKKENRSDGVDTIAFGEFLDIYKESDIYLVQDVLPTSRMAEEVFLPRCLLCNWYTDVINTAVMWFSSGGTRSVLHNDELENVNCLYDGTKEFLLIDKIHEDLVPISKAGGYSSVDVDKVDMQKYPTLSKVPWYKAKMEPGDCFYIPYLWFHQVNSSQSRNLAINIWWHHRSELPQDNICQVKSSQYEKLANFTFMAQPQSLRLALLSLLDNEEDGLEMKSFVDFFHDHPIFSGNKKMIRQLFQSLNHVSNKDGKLTKEEIQAIPVNAIALILEKIEEKTGKIEQKTGKDEL